MTGFNRRDFGKAFGAATAVAAGSATGSAKAAPIDLDFPKDFKWGCATAAYQIEGAVKEDGRGPTNWDVFSHTPGKVAKGHNGDVACDSYHRYAEDTKLLKNLGVSTYRMSLAWSRIFPSGRGAPNQKGVDHYNKVVDNLLENGIEPYVTMFHWDLPAALPGGWQNRDTALAFADYAGFMAGKLGDRVKNFMTVNELRCFTDLSHAQGQHAPGLKLPPAGVNQVRHHGVLAHGLAVQAIRAHASGAQVGIADNTTIFAPAIETDEHIAATKTAMREENAMFLTAIMEGKYLDSYLTEQGAAAPKVQAGDMAAISSPLDFVALNIYTPNYVRADPSAPKGYVILPHYAQSPRMASPWLYVGPEALYWGPRLASELWGPKTLYISENGCSADDPIVHGRVDDSDRVMYLRNYLTQLHRATAEGYPVKGYFLWSLMDNFEWADGYTKRFGIHYVDFKTQKRTPKLSAAWYKELIARNRMV